MSRATGDPTNLYDEREVMNEFISCYRYFTALWDSTSPDYLSKHKKEPGYKELLNILQRINGEACVQDVKRKINSLRCCYRREIKKVNASENSYKPRLWWFHLMDFLKPVLNIQSPSRIKSESLDDSFDETSINMYRSMPELWLVRSQAYRNRRLKDESYDRLLTLMRQFDRYANIHTLKRKINNFRTSYRRELRKVLSSAPTYVPALWYFKDLEFLCELETGDLHYARRDYELAAEPEPEPEPEPLPLQYQSNTDEYEAGQAESLGRNASGNMGFNEITEISSSSSDLDQHQVVVHHIGSDTEEDDLFAVSFPKEEDVLGGIERLSDGDPEHESYLETVADPDPNLEPEPVDMPLTSDLKLNNDFQDSLLPAKIETNSYSNNSVSRSREMDKSSGITRNNRRRRNSNDSDYDESKVAVKRPHTKEELSPDKNRNRDTDRDSDNECDLIGKRMAAHFRHMRPDQRLFAERIISEVLVFGRMDRLSLDSQFIANPKEG